MSATNKPILPKILLYVKNIVIFLTMLGNLNVAIEHIKPHDPVVCDYVTLKVPK